MDLLNSTSSFILLKLQLMLPFSLLCGTLLQKRSISAMTKLAKLLSIHSQEAKRSGVELFFIRSDSHLKAQVISEQTQ